MARFEGKSEFIKAARCRLDDAKRLLEYGENAGKRHTRGAMYISGYALECALKVYIIQAAGARTLSEAVDTLRSKAVARADAREIPDLNTSAGHRLSLLYGLTDLSGMVKHGSGLWRRIQSTFRWQSDWRYDPSQPELREAKDF